MFKKINSVKYLVTEGVVAKTYKPLALNLFKMWIFIPKGEILLLFACHLNSY